MSILDRAALRVLEALRLKVRPSTASTAQGEHRSDSVAEGLEFADHKMYAPGDDIRRIDWTAYARTRQLILRTFEQERELRVYVLLDASNSMGQGSPPKFDCARRMAAAFAYLGMKQLDRVAVIPFASTLGTASPLVRGRSGLPALERFLTPLAPDGTTSFEAVSQSFSARHPSRGLLLIVSDLLDTSDWPAGLRRLARAGHEVVLVRVTARDDVAPSLGGELDLIDSETGERLRVTVTRTLLHAYQQALSAHVEACREAVTRGGGRYVEVASEAPTALSLRRVLGAVTEAAT